MTCKMYSEITESLENQAGIDPLLTAQEIHVSLCFTETVIWNCSYSKGSFRQD